MTPDIQRWPWSRNGSSERSSALPSVTATRRPTKFHSFRPTIESWEARVVKVPRVLLLLDERLAKCSLVPRRYRGSEEKKLAPGIYCTGYDSFHPVWNDYVTCTSPLRGLISSTCARVLNHYKALFVATVGQQVPVAQRFSAVVCDVDVHGSILTVSIDFLFFFHKKT